MATVVIEEEVPVVIEVGVTGPQGPPGTLIEVEEEGVLAVTPLRALDFQSGFDVTESTPRTAQIDLDLSEVAAGGELAGTLDAPTVDALHSGSTHQSLTDNLDAHLIDVVDSHDASAISFVPTGTIVSADAQSAIVEALTDGKAYTDDGHVILSSQRGATDGVAELDAAGKVPAIELPAFSLGEVFTVASEGEMLALAATQGDMAVRTDVSQTFILADDPASVLGNWVELLNPASPVTSVNGRVGSVTGLEEAANKDAAGGYPSLDGSGYVPDSEINPAIARDTEVSDAILAHTADATDAHDASAVSLLDVANQYAATDVEAALAEVLDTEQAHEADASAAHAASAVAFTPAGTIAATDVQAAIAEVASEAAGVVVTTGRYFPEDYAGANDAVKVQAAADAAAAAGGLLVLQPAKTYVIPTGVTFLCDVDGSASTFSWTGGSSGVCVSCGNGSTTRTSGKRMKLPNVVNSPTSYNANNIGVRVWSIEDSQFFFGKVTGFGIGILTIGGATVAATSGYGVVQNNDYFIGQVVAGWPLRIEGGLCYNNEHRYYGGHLSCGGTGTQKRNIHLRYTPIPPVPVSLRSDSTAGQVDAGAHTYFFTYIDVNGHESGSIHPGVFSYTGTVTNDSSHTSNDITVPALSSFNMVGLPDAASINLYRTKAGATIIHSHLFRVATGLTPSSTYTDTATDTSLPSTTPGGPQISWGKPDSHRFYSPNVEGFLADYAVECEGSFNLFEWLRYEAVGLPYFRGAGAYKNTVFGGVGTDTQSITEVLGAVNNVLVPVGGIGSARRVSFSPTTDLSSTDAQAAIEEVVDLAQGFEDSLQAYETALGAATPAGVSLATGSATPSSITTASISPATSVVFLLLSTAKTGGAPTVSGVSGLGGTWAALSSIVLGFGGDPNAQRLSLWVGTGCSGSGTLAVTQSSTATTGHYSILEFTGIDEDNPYVLTNLKTQTGVVGSATSSYVTPDELAYPGNAFLTGTHHGQTENVTPLNGATEINDTSAISPAGLETAYKVNGSGSLGGSWSTSTQSYLTIGLEISANHILQAPYKAAPTQTGEGQIVWDSNDDHLTVGTGSSRKTLANSDDTLAATPTFLSIAKWGTN